MSQTIQNLDVLPAKQAESLDPAEASQSNFLDAITIEHGPASLLGRMFLKAINCAEARGVRLRLCTLADLQNFTQEHLKDWPTLPVFRPSLMPGGQSGETAFAILGEDLQGRTIATQAARFFDWSDTNLKAEVESLRMMYGDAKRPPGASGEVTSLEAGRLTGRVVYSGSTWFHPDYRGRELSGVLPRISRALALTRWNTETTISFMDWRIVKKGVAASYGYSNLGDSVILRNVVDPEFKAAIGWIARQELIDDAEQFLRDFPVEWTNGAEAGRRHYGG